MSKQQPERQNSSSQNQRSESQASGSRSGFEPEEPRQGPQVRRTKSSQDEAKRRLVRSKSSSIQPENESRSSTPTVQEGSSSPSKTRSASPTKPRSEAASEVTSWNQYGQLAQMQKIRIRADVTKSTSFDREKDGELYDLWVGPP